MRQRAQRLRLAREERLEQAGRSRQLPDEARTPEPTEPTQPSPEAGSGSSGTRTSPQTNPSPELRRLLPNFNFTTHSQEIPLIALGIYEVGIHNAWRLEAVGPSPAVISPAGPGIDLGLARIQLGVQGNIIELTVKTSPRTDVLDQGQTIVGRSLSVSTRFEWRGWQSLVSTRINVLDLRVSGPSESGFSGLGSQGVYFEQKPVQIVTGLVVAGAVAVGTYFLGPQVGDAVGRWYQGLSNPVLIPGG